MESHELYNSLANMKHMSSTQPLSSAHKQSVFMAHKNLLNPLLHKIKLMASLEYLSMPCLTVGLAGKEHSNPQFMFLKPTHSMFGFFTSLCDAYSRVLMPDKGLMQKLHQDASDR